MKKKVKFVGRCLDDLAETQINVKVHMVKPLILYQQILWSHGTPRTQSDKCYESIDLIKIRKLKWNIPQTEIDQQTCQKSSASSKQKPLAQINFYGEDV